MKPFEICRPGTFVDASGRAVTITEAMLREMATGYNTKLRCAALCLGHPKQDDPAYGWVKDLDYRDGALVAEPERVDGEFEMAVKDGHFPNRSASFFVPNTPNNPTPGRYYLKHVGFLGGAQPAVDGLRPVEFSAFDDEAGNDLVVSLAGYEGFIRAQERKRLEDEVQLSALANNTLREAMRKVVKRENELEELTGDLIKKAILRPTEKDQFVALASHLSETDGIICFGSGDDAGKEDAFTLLKRLMEGRAPLVQLGETPGLNGPLPGGQVNLCMPEDVPSNLASSNLHDQASNYQAVHGGTYRDAVLAVSGGRR